MGTAEDNLALREEEEKQRKARIKKLLPKNGGNYFKNFSYVSGIGAGNKVLLFYEPV